MSNKDQETAASTASRIGQLAVLPVFFKLDGKRVVLAGGGEPALWKAELLAASGALVDVISEDFEEGFRALAATPPHSRVSLLERRWTVQDLTGAALAVGSFGDVAEAAAFATAARAAGVPVNIVDRPQLCDFQFGAIVNRSPLVVGISTDGAAPVFGQAIRSLIEGLLPESMRLWAKAARDLRQDRERLGDTPDKKRRFWQRFADSAIRNSGRGPDAAELDRLAASEVQAGSTGDVTIIDIDGTTEALTLGAIRALRIADDIYFDEGVSSAVTDFARREARRHLIAAGGGNSDAIRETLIESARAGRSVARVRLRAATRENELEIRALRDAGLSVVLAPSAVTI